MKRLLTGSTFTTMGMTAAMVAAMKSGSAPNAYGGFDEWGEMTPEQFAKLRTGTHAAPTRQQRRAAERAATKAMKRLNRRIRG